MATRPELQHTPTQALQQNRARLRTSQNNINRIQNDEPRDSRPAMDKPIREGKPHNTPQTDKAAKVLTGKASDFALVEGQSDDALGVKGARVKRELKAQNNVEEKNAGRSDVRKSDLKIPITRAKRMTTEDGRTSFHFSHDSVTKTNREVVSESGRANRPGAAKAHNKYIERDSAVALDQDGVDKVPANDTDVAAEGAAINDNDGVAVVKEENNIVPSVIGESFLRAYRGKLAALFADPDGTTAGGSPGEDHRLQHVPGGRVVPDGRDAEMLLWATAVPVIRGDGASGQGLRRERDGDPEGNRGNGEGRLGSSHKVADKLPRAIAGVVKAVVGKKAPAAQPRDAANDPRTVEGQGAYIERQEALAIQPDGTRVLYTNIDEDPAERAEFWRLVEEHERAAEPDKISFQIDRNPAFWTAVAKHKDCPAELSEAIANAKNDKPVRVAAGDNVSLRKFLSKIDGWDDVGARRDGETPDEYKLRRADALCHFHDGRGGRVQYRIIGELPYELDIAGRASILKKFSDEFAKRKLPFVAVMHAPDHTNSDKNWHFHLVYYDRPCSRVTLDQAQENSRKRHEADPRVKPEPNMDHVGRWDFSIAETYVRPGRYEKRVNYPYIQDKSKEVNRDKAWIEILRKKLADITNDHLEEAGIERRLDHRRHEEMGIHADPQEHLGTRLANLEAMGIATPKGVSNEERQWVAVLEKLNRDLDYRKNAVDRQATKWLRQLEQSGHGEDVRRNVRTSITRWHQHRIEAEEHEAIALNVNEHMDRLTSRAQKVITTCRKHLDAIEQGMASKYQASRRKQLQAKADEAHDWLVEINKMLESERKLERDARAAAERERLIADVLENTIERSLLEGGRVVPDRSATKKPANDQTPPDRKSAAQPIAANAEIENWVRRIAEQRRRLKREGRNIFPAVMTDEDQAMIASPNYPGIRNRLVKLKEGQDRIIRDVVTFIEQRPDTVIQQRGREAVGHILIGARPALAQAFRDYQDDAAITKARDAALQIQRDLAAAKQRDIAANDRREEQRRERADERRVEREAENRSRIEQEELRARENQREAERDRKEAVARARAISEAIVRAVTNGPLRVYVRDGVATLSAADLAQIKATREQLDDAATQKRLVGIAGVQAREIKRLTGYVRAAPRQVIIEDESFSLRANAPVEMVEIARRWKNDPVLTEELKAIRDAVITRGRQPALPLEEDRRAAPVPAREVRPTPVQESSKAAPEPRGEQNAKQPVPAPAKDDRRPAPTTPSNERITTLAPDLEMREQARKRAEERRLAEEAAEARRNATKRPVNNDASTAGDRVARRAAQRSPLESSHPLIRAWAKANQEGRAEDRAKLAFEIENDRTARVELQSLDRDVVRRIREEARRIQEERQPSLGLDLGLAPKRDE